MVDPNRPYEQALKRNAATPHLVVVLPVYSRGHAIYYCFNGKTVTHTISARWYPAAEGYTLYLGIRHFRRQQHYFVICNKPFLMKLKKEDIERIRLAKDLLTKNRRYHITINDLSQQTQLNRTKLQYGFKQLFGVSIDDYRIFMRMEKAKELLEQTEKSVKEISILVGYKSMGSFSTMFKKIYSKSPTEWRNGLQG